MKKVLFTATVDSHILHFHIPFLKLFKEKGYEVHVATNGTEEIPYCDVKHTVSFERSPYSFKNLKAIKQLKKIISEEKFDIIHCHTPMGGVVTRLASKKARKKYHTRVIYTAHGFHFYKGAPIHNWLLFYPVEKYLAKYTDTLITINKEDYELANKKFSKRCHNIEYVPGVGIDENKFNFKMTKKEKSDLRKSLGLKDSDFVMIYPAEISKRKNQMWLINSIDNLLKEHSDIHLLLPGKDSLNGKCQELVKKLNLENQIHFLGYRKDIPKLLKISNLSVSSAKQEGLPVNIMEAMYVGLPIVATDCRGNRDLVEDGKNGYLIKQSSIKIFIDSVVKVYSNVSKYNKINKAQFKYLVDSIILDMEKIYFVKKCIAYLRSTAIYNDSRATKEINSYNKNDNKVLAFGWNRKLETINFDDKKLNKYFLLNLKANYGSGLKGLFKMLKFEFWLNKQLKLNIDEIDIIHACDFDTAFVASHICKKYNKKLIYDIYDYYVDCHNLGFLKSIIEKKDINVINYSDCVLLCTEKRKEQISKSHPKRIEVIHNSPNIIDSILKKHTKINKINVGYFGILQDDRLLIEISKEIIKNKNIVLHIGGFGKYEEYFSDLSKRYSNVIFYGTLSYSEVLKLEQKCDILFATYNPKVKNHKYSAPNKVYEAMALVLPIIVCKDTGIDDLVISENLGEVINYDASEFIDAVFKRIKLDFHNSNNIFKNKYSWEIMEYKLSSVVKDLRY